MSKRITVVLDEREFRNLNYLLERYGGKPGSYFHILLKEAYEKEFGSYKADKGLKVLRDGELAVMTNEQKCERRGGKPVRDGAGNSICEFRKPGTGIVGTVSMSNPEGFDAMADRMGL